MVFPSQSRLHLCEGLFGIVITQFNKDSFAAIKSVLHHFLGVEDELGNRKHNTADILIVGLEKLVVDGGFVREVEDAFARDYHELECLEKGLATWFYFLL